MLLREAMNVGKIGLHAAFRSVEMEPREAKKQLRDEALNYCVVTEAPKTTFGKGANPHSNAPQRYAVGNSNPNLTRGIFAWQCAKHTRANFTVATPTPNPNPTSPSPNQSNQPQPSPLLGKQDDLIISLQLAIIGCQRFFSDAKYRSFRANDYDTPQGLAEGRRPSGVV